MPTIKGRNVKVEVALTFDTPIAPTAITKAFPPVATLTAHGLADGEAGFFAITDGMVELEGQAILVDNATATTFELPGLDSTDYSTYVAAGSTLSTAATWGTLAESTAYAVGGGASTQLDDTRLIDAKNRNEAGNLASQDVTIDIKPQETSGAAMAFIERQAQRARACLFKISKGGKVLRVFYGVPSLPGESVSAGQLATGQLSVTVPAWVIKPNVV